MENTLAREMLAFIEESPTAFHAAAAAERRLEGYTRLEEREAWRLVSGGRYYVTRGGSSLAAFRVPRGQWQGFLLAAAHSDSPAFKLKENPMLPGPSGYLRLNAEPYGGMLRASWADRPLGVAGRLLVGREGRIESVLVRSPGDVAVIPNVAIHMNREANSGFAYDPKTDLVPLMGLGGEGDLLDMAAAWAGVERRAVLGSDLCLYPTQPGRLWGPEGELVSSPRLDDLQGVFGILTGFLAGREQGKLPVLCVFDNEEVGSATRQGADGSFLRDVLGRICAALGRELPAEGADSFLVSADNAHAVHPNHPEYADAGHQPRMNGGVVIKHSAGQRYTTDGLSSAVFAEICRRAQVPVQHFANRSDLPGGSTLGNLSNRQISLHAVDIGLAQLAMHSAWETAGARDTAYLCRAMTAFYSAPLRVLGDGAVTLE